MSTAGSNGTPFVNGLKDMQGFTTVLRIQAASPTETQDKNDQSYNILHQKISPILRQNYQKFRQSPTSSCKIILY
ncbi:MAG: hypothetical protein KAW01_02990, partial [Deltaproteobacteria bacterium]|nr:hypothetical protein [Deltaproteobacteria bacterium]